jgi:CelD/BcsL family acetyltransferase involved in cellulose biosynthesis
VEESLAWEQEAELWHEVAWQAGAFYLSFAWLRPWWECYGNQNLSLSIVMRGSRPIALAPLTFSHCRWYGMPVNKVGNLFNPHACRSDVALLESKRECLSLILDALERNPWDVIFLREIPVRSAFLVHLSGLSEERGLRVHCRPSLDSPYVTIQGTWEEYLSTRPKKFREELRRKSKRLRASGMKARYDCLEGCADIEAVLPELMVLAERSWSGQKGTSIASGRNRGFYNAVILKLAARGCARVWTLRLDGALAAFRFQIPWARGLSTIKSCYDPRFEQLTPGSLLDRHVMQSLFETHEFGRYDLLGSDNFYKSRWTDDLERHVEVFVFNDRPVSRALEALEFHVRPRLGAVKRGLLRLTNGAEKP